MKRRRLARRDEGDSGPDGVLLDLELEGDGIYNAIYSVPVTVGTSNPATYRLQVDTGSSDLWLASDRCSTSACQAVGSSGLYDPGTAIPTNQPFSIQYLSGSVQGDIVWDTVELGHYSIDNQALVAASSVDSEPLSSNFVGILGISLPKNSVILQTIGAGTSDAPDGAALSSNLYGITPSTERPNSRFMSLSLSRPGTDRIPSRLGIGRHPESLGEVQVDPAKISYTLVDADPDGSRFWRTLVTSVNIYVNGEDRPPRLGTSVSGAAFPRAIIDSGVPSILTTTPIANAIYGAIGVSPAADGTYYVPCTTPLNMTITLDDIPPISLHPLDMAAPPADDPSATNCIGAIQAFPAMASGPPADLVLGIPFLRNVYTVFSDLQPAPNGTIGGGGVNGSVGGLKPNLGFLPLTNITTALNEFNLVRVQHKALPGSGEDAKGKAAGNSGSSSGKLSVGLGVLIGLVGFFLLCGALFTIRWILIRRRFKGQRAAEAGMASNIFFHSNGRDHPDTHELSAMKTKDSHRSTFDGHSATGDTARTLVFSDEFGLKTAESLRRSSLSQRRGYNPSTPAEEFNVHEIHLANARDRSISRDRSIVVQDMDDDASTSRAHRPENIRDPGADTPLLHGEEMSDSPITPRLSSEREREDHVGDLPLSSSMAGIGTMRSSSDTNRDFFTAHDAIHHLPSRVSRASSALDPNLQ